MSRSNTPSEARVTRVSPPVISNALVRSRERLDRSRGLIGRQHWIVAAARGDPPSHESATRVLLLLQDGLFELAQAHDILANLSRDDRPARNALDHAGGVHA